ncbi:cyclin-J18-like protein isoform X1 [Cinnamomum micranthum f. kanehirae]|uniref:Cyclin-J18-like protein isoform X1 n=1 Tax=Cinnamomum micranthum f. kanehirae TaxID=337451 RepID=A0A443N997_9MAGN|nr:cyclin-J18-like protein isoform X1 [Cinnamomum micranthum f. kanehirae]
MESFGLHIPPHVRRHVLEFFFLSSSQLRVPPIVKYTALSLFADRFFRSLRRKSRLLAENDTGNWLLQPLRIHDTSPLSVKSLKSLGDEIIKDQHFTTRDFAEAELVFMKVLGFEIGALNIAFIFLEDLLLQFRELSKVGDLVNFDACMNVMDLLYETEETSMIYSSPHSLAASVLVASYVLTVPKQQWEFPLLPWVKFVTSYGEEEIGELVKGILQHVFQTTTEWEGFAR